MDVHGENGFKIKTYSNIAFLVERFPTPLANLDLSAISKIRGIGESSAKHIVELIATGKLSLLEKYISVTPPGILEMMRVKGIGAKKINVIWKELEIESVGELLYACNENRLARHKGFGPKTEQNLKETLDFYLSKQGFFLYKAAKPYNDFIITLIQEKFTGKRIFSTGDFRSQSETIEALSFVTDVPASEVKQLCEQEEGFDLVKEEGGMLFYKRSTGPAVKLYCCNPASFITTLFFTTGSHQFISEFRHRFPAAFGCEGNDLHEEKVLFEKAAIPYIPPYLREHASVIDLAVTKGIPQPLMPEQVKGIIHCHSIWSDGIHPLREMALHAIAKGFEYLVITDHSRSAAYANGLSPEKVAAQHKEIEGLNSELAPFRIFKGIESDILSDGSLDYDFSILETFDLVIASVHAGLKMPQEKATARLIKAIENPFTTILGHMTGRLLLSRGGYPIDYEKVIDACAANKVAIEINANSRRLDMDWRWIPYALSKNVMMSINPDAHSIQAFDDIHFGILSAQKGMLPVKSNLSSLNLADFEKYLHAKKNGRK